MTNSSFIHLADVHLDSPLANVQRLDETTAARLQSATRQSLEQVMDLALERDIGAVLIAGDLFDAPVRDVSAALWVERQFRRLTQAGIHVVMIRGNHDAQSSAGRVSLWPEGVHELSAAQPETVLLDQIGLAVHGQSFGARVETNDLAAQYPQPVPGYFNVGLLHTSLSGAVGHDTYAPTSTGTLENVGYDYWALGHIHGRSQTSLSTQCYVGYSGNTQGRHIHESGAKGCQLVRIVDGKLAEIEFAATDSLRWHLIDVDVSKLEHLRDIEECLPDLVLPLLEAADGRPLAVRTQLSGASALHRDLTSRGTVDQLTETLASRLAELGDVWLESVKVASTPYFDAPEEDLMLPLKYLSLVGKQCQEDPALREELGQVLEELLKNARSDLNGYDWPLADLARRDAELERCIRRAEEMLVARLATGGAA